MGYATPAYAPQLENNLLDMAPPPQSPQIKMENGTKSVTDFMNDMTD